MANTTFTDGVTVVVSEWLNEVNDVVYEVLGDGINAPTTKAGLRTALDVPQNNGTGASGTWGINITGNAATATSATSATTATTATTALGPIASTTTSGIVELATDAEAQAGTDATRAVTPDNLGATILGLGQTWQDLTGSRVAGTLYTNSTGRVIKFQVSGVITANLGSTSFFEVGGQVVGNIAGNGATANQHYSQGYEVPPGATYRILSVAGTTISRWSELR